MKISTYTRAERRIAASDGAGVVERWRWGRAALADHEVTNPAGTLRRGRGIAEQLIHAARSKGLSLSEREIQRRLQLARSYSSEVLTRHAVARYGTWRDLCDAGFPTLDDGDQGDGQPALIDQAGHVDPAAEAWQQPPLDDAAGSVFPRLVRVAGADHDRDQTTLDVLTRYVDACERWTAGHARRNARMREHLADLTQVCGGDTSTTYGQACAALERQGAA